MGPEKGADDVHGLRRLQAPVHLQHFHFLLEAEAVTALALCGRCAGAQHAVQTLGGAFRQLLDGFGAGHLNRGQNSRGNSQGFHLGRSAGHAQSVLLDPGSAKDEMGVTVDKPGGDDLSASIHNLGIRDIHLRSNFPGRADREDPLSGDGHGSFPDPSNQIVPFGSASENFRSPGDQEIGPGLWGRINPFHGCALPGGLLPLPGGRRWPSGSTTAEP